MGPAGISAAAPTVSTLAIGAKTTGVAVSPDGTKAYVSTLDAGGGNGLVGVLDTSNDTVVATIPVGRQPFGIAFLPTGAKAFVANVDSNTVSEIDVATNTVRRTIAVAGGPRDIAATPDGSKLYVASMWSSSVSVIDTATSTVMTTLTVGSHPVSVAVAPDGSKAYVTNNGAHSVSVIDTATNTVTTTFPAGKNPSDVVFTPNGAKAYLANISESTVSVIDVATNTETTRIPFEPNVQNVAEQPYSLAVSPDGTTLFAVLKTRKVKVVDTGTDQVTSTISGLFSGYAWGAALTPDTSKLYTTDITVNTMSIVALPAPDRTVTFDSNGGTGTMPAQTASSSTALATNAFTRAGYTFAGWNTAANGTGTGYPDAAAYPFTASVTLYAQWAPPSPPAGTVSVGAATVRIDIAVGSPAAGAPVSVTGSGLRPTSPFSLVVRSTPVTISTGTVDGAGTINATAYLPRDLSAGWHSLTFTSTGADGSSTTAQVYFEITSDGRILRTSPSPRPDTEIASTGFDMPWEAGLLAGAALTGGALMMSRRRTPAH